jgi:HPt (histidine-containing phosphotransfer) domain-containing protein
LHYHLTRAIERQLQRGIQLPPMPARAARAALSTAELDAMFGVLAGPPPLAVAAGRNPGRRAGDLKSRLRAAFLADLPRRRAELDMALDAGDGEAAGRLLHGLRGSAGYLEAAHLHALCGELEAEADAGRLDAVRARLPELLDLLARIEAAPA